MFISVDLETATVGLAEPSVFTAFHVVADSVDASGSAVAEALGEAGASLDDDHVWIAVAAVRSLAGSAVDADWESSFQGMLGYAASKGWCNDTNTMIRAHIERA